jgi:hypothetical protein
MQQGAPDMAHSKASFYFLSSFNEERGSCNKGKNVSFQILSQQHIHVCMRVCVHVCVAEREVWASGGGADAGNVTLQTGQDRSLLQRRELQGQALPPAFSFTFFV